MAGASRGPDAADQVLRIQVLGGFHVAIGPRELDERSWGLRKASALVKLLALTPGHRLHRERVIDALWPELSLAAGNNSLHRTLHAARHALDPDRPAGAPTGYLTLRGDTLSLGPPGSVVVDVDVFRAVVAAARQSQAAAAYRRAIALYGGDLLPDDLYDDWSITVREELRELFCELLAAAAQTFAPAAPDEAIQTLRRLVAIEPTREDAHVALMRLLAHGGRRYDALRQYQQLRAILRDELAAEPDAATQRLYEAIQAGRLPAARGIVAVDASARDPHATASEESQAVSRAADDTRHAAERAGNGAAGAIASDWADRRGSPPAPAGTLAGHVTSFVGRVREHEALSDLLAAQRLVTVVGPGGCGKTRLALHTAGSLRQAYLGGVTLIELGSLDDATLVPQAVALALGIREQAGRPIVATLAAALATQAADAPDGLVPALLVLDNCEHVRDACAQLADALLAACPQVRILATSRRPLGLAAEATLRLRPLATPDPDALPPFSALLAYDAIRLFVERAAASRPGFALTADNADAVVRICHRLDGLPLAIELAAGRRRVLTVEQIAARLDDALALLGGGSDELPRQATVRATIGWSWALLAEPERVLLRRLAVFAGGWTLDAAEAICTGSPSPRAGRPPDAPTDSSPSPRAGRPPDTPTDSSPSPSAVVARPASPLAGGEDPSPASPSPRGVGAGHVPPVGPGGEEPDVLDLLARLVEHSLVVVVERGTTPRYRLLETIRQYAASRLRESDEEEEEALRLRHARWLLEMVTAAEAGLRGSEQDAWLARLDVENDNLRAALAWACDAGEVELAGNIAGPATRYWYLRGTLREGQRWLERILALDDARGQIAPPAVRARMFRESGVLALYQGDHGRATTAGEESLRLARSLGDLLGMNVALSVLTGAAEIQGDYRRAADLAAESLQLARELGDADRIMLGLSNLADELLYLGELARAGELYAESLALAERAGNQHRTAMALTNLGRVALRQGNTSAAEAPLERALAIMRALNIPRGAGEALLPLGELALARGASAQAITRYREALDEYQRADSGMEVAQALEGMSRALAASRQAERGAHLLGAAEALRERLRTPRSPEEAARHRQDVAALRALLGAEALAAALAAGRALPIEHAIAVALRAEDDSTAPAHDHRAGEGDSVGASGGRPLLASGGRPLPTQSDAPLRRRGVRQTPPLLSPRERQIAEMVAAGLTNREIAARLRIAPRTADTHVANVLAKLDLRSRAEVGPWLRAHPNAGPR